MSLLHTHTTPFSLLARDGVTEDMPMRLRFVHGDDLNWTQQVPFGVLNNSAYSFAIPFDGAPDRITFGLTGPHTLDGFVQFNEPLLSDVLYSDVTLRLSDMYTLGGMVINGEMTVEYNGWRVEAVPEPSTITLGVLLLCLMLLRFCLRLAGV